MCLRRTQKWEITTTIGSLDAKSIMPRAILSMYRLHKLHKTHTNTPSNDAANDDDAAIVYCALILCLRRPWHCQNISHTETQYEPIDFPKFAKSLNWFIYFTEVLSFHYQPTKTHKLSDELNWNAFTCKLNCRECRDGKWISWKSVNTRNNRLSHAALYVSPVFFQVSLGMCDRRKLRIDLHTNFIYALLSLFPMPDGVSPVQPYFS